MPLSHLHPRVLVVDADADTRAMYQMALQSAGCDVLDAADGRDALAKALVRAPSLVITELRLPHIDGVALCDILRKDRMTADVPILLVTTETRPSELQRARRVGVDAIVTKPTTPEQLLDEVRSLLVRFADLREDADAAQRNASAQAERSRELLADSKRSSLSKSHARFTTTTPPSAPDALTCPRCDRLLIYQSSYIGGVSVRHQERWDTYKCDECGSLIEYRVRTRTKRRVEPT